MLLIDYSCKNDFYVVYNLLVFHFFILFIFCISFFLLLFYVFVYSFP